MHQLTIMMATYNGAEFIREQLHSFERQEIAKIRLVVSDDGSSDETLNIIQEHCANSSILDATILEGPRKGFASNFRHLILETDLDDGYFAFSDQDDIWVDDKTTRSIQWLDTKDHNIPALYCGRTQLMSHDGKITGELSTHFKNPPCFQNALVQSIAGANTMTMNKTAFQLLRKSVVYGTPVSHDWWSYLMVTGADGAVNYDAQPLVSYRQHVGNLVGSNNSIAARTRRIKMAINGRFREWNKENIEVLEKCDELLTSSNQTHFETFKKIHNSRLFNRLKLLGKSGIHRQTASGQRLLWIAALLGKL